MLDHLGLDVTDYERSKAFYERALAPLGIELIMEPVPGVGGFGDGGKPYFWVGRRGRPAQLHRFAPRRRGTRLRPVRFDLLQRNR